MVREAQLLDFGQQMLFEAAIEDLGRPSATSVDIENGLGSLGQLRTLSLQQSRAILNLARNNMSAWVQASDSLQAIEAVTPSLTAYREHVEQSNTPQLREEYTEIASTILSGVITVDPRAYQQTVARPLRQGAFGEYGPILAGITNRLSETMEQRGTIHRHGEEDDYSSLIGFMRELIDLNDPSLVETIKLAIPGKLLYMDQAQRMKLSPEIRQFLENARVGNDSETSRLVHLYLVSDYSDQDKLRERILKGEFGDAATVVDKIVSSLVSGRNKHQEVEQVEADESAYELWLDMIDKDSSDPKLRSVTANVIELDQYWQGGEQAVYICTASLDRLGLRIGEEELFVMKYGDRILDILKANSFGQALGAGRFQELEKQEHLTEEQQQRIARFLRELRLNEKDSGQNIHSIIQDNLLSTVL